MNLNVTGIGLRKDQHVSIIVYQGYSIVEACSVYEVLKIQLEKKEPVLLNGTIYKILIEELITSNMDSIEFGCIIRIKGTLSPNDELKVVSNDTPTEKPMKIKLKKDKLSMGCINDLMYLGVDFNKEYTPLFILSEGVIEIEVFDTLGNGTRLRFRKTEYDICNPQPTFGISDTFLAECLVKFRDGHYLDMLQEECGELIVACSKTRREKPNAIANLKEEMAHVLISSAILARSLGITDADIALEVQKKLINIH